MRNHIYTSGICMYMYIQTYFGCHYHPQIVSGFTLMLSILASVREIVSFM